MRISRYAAVVVLSLSCTSRQHAVASLALSCVPPGTATQFDSSQVEQLAGVYALTLVTDSFPSHGARAFGRLRLRVNTDTLRRYYAYSALANGWRRVGERPLVGTLEMNLDAIFAPYSNDPRSTNLDAPGVVFGVTAGQFLIGYQPNLLDGTSTSLIPAVVWPDGFQGRWEPHYGIAQILNSATGQPAHVGGDFCAVRTR